MKKTILVLLAFLWLLLGGFVILKSPAHAAVDQDIGIPVYPGAKQNPAYPPISTSHMKNLHLLTQDPFEKVVEWYSQKLGKFRVDRQKKGNQALWTKETKDGDVQTVTISTINAPAGQTNITLTKGKLKK